MNSPRVELWYARTESVDADVADAIVRLLTPDETTRHGRYVFDRHRREYLVTRGLERGVLSRFVGRPAASLAFHRTDLDRPVLDDAPGVFFNLTNSVELVACAVRRDGEVGVDVEALSRADQVLDIAKTVFTDAELSDLAALPLEPRRRRAVQLWTLKEAYIKARGMGLSLPVRKVNVSFADSSAPALSFYVPVDDVVGRWHLRTFEVEGHLVSTCTEVSPSPASSSGPAAVPEITLERADLGALLGVR